MLILITYDLKQPDRNYEPLYLAIKQCGDKWWHYMDSVWLVHTNLNPQQCFDRLRLSLDENDYVLVLDITRQQRQGWLPKDAWDWVKENDN